MRPAQLPLTEEVEIGDAAKAYPCFNEAGAAAPVCPFARPCEPIEARPASMRPAQLRRFAEKPPVDGSVALLGFNEAGAAAPVCHGCRHRCRQRLRASMRPAQLRRFAGTI